MSQNKVLAENEYLESERLILRKFRLTDAADLLDYWGDERVVRQTGTSVKSSLESAKKLIADWMIPEQLIIWALEEKEAHKLIGHIELHIENDQAELGWLLNYDFWGRGLMPEAASCLRDFAFKKLKLTVLTASCFPENGKSKRVMEKIGMEKLGQIYVTIKTRAILSDYYALTKEDYFNGHECCFS